MYKFIGLAMMGVFVMMIIPGNFDAVQGENNLMYGMATMVKNDSLGNEVFQQSVHNQLAIQGEAVILESVFKDTGSLNGVDDANGIGAICVTDATIAVADAATDALTAVTFDTANTLDTPGTSDVCEEDVAGATITSSVGDSSATLVVTIASDADNVANGAVITGIGICQIDTDSADTFYGSSGAGCAAGGVGTSGILFAAISVTSTTLNTGETVDITYKFDITSATT